ncbi:MAG: PspC domain-containing protein [Planctomyces sp.]|nr:PspC domain-containing protein [Planctomyces sp.]
MSLSDELERLSGLHARGVLTDDEFARAKELVLSGSVRPIAREFQTSLNSLRRSRRDAYLGGVCTGLSEITGLPVWIWRAAFVILAASFGVGIVLYLVLWLLIPPDSLVERPSADG